MSNKLFSETDESANPEIAKAADAFIEARDGLEEAKKEFKKAQGFLVNEMNKSMKTRVHHHGRTLTVKNTDPKQVIQIKDINFSKRAGGKK